MMNEEGFYISQFLAEDHTPEEILAWAAAYKQYMSEPNCRAPWVKAGWCQKKADDDWQQFISSCPWGRDNLMVISAVRYCLGRTTYIVSDCCDWLIEQWPNFPEHTRAVVHRDVEEEFKRDDWQRECGDEYADCRALGHDCDRAQWERVRKLWEEKE